MKQPKQVLRDKAGYNSSTPYYMGDTIKTAADGRDGDDVQQFQKLSNTEQSSFDRGSDYGS